MYNSFFYPSKFNFNKFLSLLPKKKNTILDYGCGNGIYNNKVISNNKINLIKMYDKDKKLKNTIKKKYLNNSKIKWVNTIYTKHNVVLINSVIQYLTLYEYNKLINFFLGKHIDILIISDIPKYPRYLEAIILLFINPLRLFVGLSYIFRKNYLKSGFNYREYKKLVIQNSNYKYKIDKNLNEDSLLRYLLIIKKYNK